jgi:hypothetical protein
MSTDCMQSIAVAVRGCDAGFAGLPMLASRTLARRQACSPLSGASAAANGMQVNA